MKNKVISLEEAVSKVRSGDTLMIGGFMDAGTPKRILEALAKTDVKKLTVIANDSSFVGKSIGLLIDNKQVSKLIASHIGTNRETGRQMIAGELEVELVPQGTLIEQIRARGFGLGGFLTQTGLGTAVQDGKQVISIDGEDYLLEKPLKADIALLFANQADRKGNLRFHGSTQNFNNMMATAADHVIVEVDEYIEEGYIHPDSVHVPGIFVDGIVVGEVEDNNGNG